MRTAPPKTDLETIRTAQHLLTAADTLGPSSHPPRLLTTHVRHHASLTYLTAVTAGDRSRANVENPTPITTAAGDRPPLSHGAPTSGALPIFTMGDGPAVVLLALLHIGASCQRSAQPTREAVDNASDDVPEKPCAARQKRLSGAGTAPLRSQSSLRPPPLNSGRHHHVDRSLAIAGSRLATKDGQTNTSNADHPSTPPTTIDSRRRLAVVRAHPHMGAVARLTRVGHRGLRSGCMCGPAWRSDQLLLTPHLGG